MKTLKADISDIFSSIQGEGVFVGARQIFIRFKRCNLACAYCDEPRNAAARDYSPEQLLRDVKAIEKDRGPHHSVSLTGGEPLVYADFLTEFLELLKKAGSMVYLETNGTLPEELAKIIDRIDIVAMDIKLPSSTLGPAHWDEHARFLKIASAKKVFVKTVVTAGTTAEEIKRASGIITGVNAEIPFIIQPATPIRPAERRTDPAMLLGFIDIASGNRLENVWSIPQMHKIWNVK